jgi:hypothetical protein
MIYFTQLIYIHPGQEHAFHQFEEVAIPLIGKYNGKLLLRTRPAAESLVAGEWELPYEIHLVSFENEADFEAFSMDKGREKVLHLKNASVRKVVLVKGMAL